MQPKPRYTGVITHFEAKKMLLRPDRRSGDFESQRLFFPNDIAPGMMELLSQGETVNYSLRRDRFGKSKLATDVRYGASEETGAPNTYTDNPAARAAASATKTVGEFRGVIVHVDYERCYGFIVPKPAEPDSGDKADQRFFLLTAFTSNSLRTPPMHLPVTYSLQRDARGPSHPDVAVNVAPREDGASDTGSDVDAENLPARLASASFGTGPVNDCRGVATGFDRKKKKEFTKPSDTAPQRTPEFMPQFPGVQYTLRANTHIPSRRH